MRSSATVLILISCFFAKFARSQSNELIIQGVTGKLYLEHTVVAKENWYSVGRLYNVSPKELAPFNHLTLAQPLIIGQTLQIPLTAANFSQDGLKPAGETLIPVIHVTREKEWMYRISADHNKVPIPDIEKWNNVTPDQIHPGMHLIVGYLKVKTALSALATNAPESPATTPRVTEVPKPAASSSGTTPPVPASSSPASAPPVATTTRPAAAEPATAAPTTSTQPAAVMPKPTGPPPAANVPATSTPAASAISTPATSAPTTSAPATSTPRTSAPATSAPPPPAPVVSTTPASPAPHFNGGNFRSDYNESGKSTSGQAGVFKSTSGWQDGKYYALMNNVTVGTIVRITDPTTSKTVYAKILGQLPDMKESAGLAIRMSNAAAAELGESETRFAVQISY